MSTRILQAQLKTAQAQLTTKAFNRTCKADQKEKLFLKIFQHFKKIKIQRHTVRQTQQTMTEKLSIDVIYGDERKRRPAGNIV